jgi:hypothetical protein
MAPVRVPGEQAGEVLVHGRVVVEQAAEADGCVGQAVPDRLRARPLDDAVSAVQRRERDLPVRALLVLRPVSRGLSAVAETVEHGERPELKRRYGEEFLPFLRRRIT